MGSDVLEDVEVLPFSCNVKVHGLMCRELAKFVDRITRIFPAIESARPRCTSGLQALCSLNIAMDKAKLLLQDCAESSKLYLAITGERIVLKCESIRNALDLCLSQIQNMVPQVLTAQISEIVNDLRGAKFAVESTEEEVGRVVLALLQQDTTEIAEFKAFQFAALRLHITSPKDLLIERRSLNKLLGKITDTDKRKESVLKYLLCLLRKHGKSVGSERPENIDSQCEGSVPGTDYIGQHEITGNSIQVESHTGLGSGEAQTDVFSTHLPPEEFRCPISKKLMYDPVVIASGKTYERIWIEKWFSEGHDTCPKTHKKLSNLSMTPNSCVKDLISNWCQEHGISIQDPCLQPIPEAFSFWNNSCSNSISSFSSSLYMSTLLLDQKTAEYSNQSDTSYASITSSDASSSSDSSHIKIFESLKDGHAEILSGNDDSHISQSFANFSPEMYSEFLSKLAELPLESQSQEVEYVKILLKDDDGAYHSMLSNGFMQELMRFLKDAHDLSNAKAQKAGAQIFLALVSNSRGEIPSLCDDEFDLLVSFLASEIVEEALAIMQVLSSYRYYKSKILESGALSSVVKALDSQIGESRAHAVKILYDLSLHNGIGSHILSLGCISKLVPLLGDCVVAGNCIKFLKNLSNTEEARVAIAETTGCIASIVELLDSGTNEEQEDAVVILLALCSHNSDHCLLVMKEGVIPSLVTISVNGNSGGRESSMKLLSFLRDLRDSDIVETPLPQIGSIPELSQDAENCSIEKQPPSKHSTFLSRKLRFFSKPKSLALS